MRNIIDLHLHFDGSITVPMARRLSEMDDGALDEVSDEDLFGLLSVGSEVTDLNTYLAKFNLPLSLLQTAGQISECVMLVQEELAARGFKYAELRFAPQFHGERGLSQQEAVEAAVDGLHRSGFAANLILCCMRGQGNEAANEETLRLAAEWLGKGVCAVDLAGAEALYPTSAYADLFVLARELDLPYTIHAGEADGPESVRAALAFGARRIGHGVRAAEDPALVEELASSGVLLEVCPTSEVQTGVFGCIGEMPIPQLFDAGVRLCINADNMMVSDTDAVRDLQLVSEAFGLDEDVLQRLLLNAAEGSFADESTKEMLRAAILNSK